ncbi:MAG: tetratricopeptide repeat protein, partial [Gemmataceae bacterium]|nr:tetratricopeptide repeat protein [Gemmataceae bacterium]
MNPDIRAAIPPPESGWPKAIPLLVLIGLLTYSNSFTKDFVLDDVSWITNHRHIDDFERYIAEWNRIVVRLSIQLNYKLGGLNLPGYHAFNGAVHILATLTLFGIIRRVLRQPRWADRYGPRADGLAFAVALLWMVHPLQTQAVTYIIQRCESMMGLFYLFTFYAWMRGATGGRRWWYVAAITSFALSAGCKEVAGTLPPVLAIFDRIFLASSWRELRGRWLAYLAIGVIWIIVLIPFARTALGGGTTVGLGMGLPSVTPYTYLLTQSEVILHYLRLSVWPVHQALDYLDWPIAQSIRDVWPAFVAVSTLLLGSIVLLYFCPVWGFVGFWFFGILAPTSSVIPIIDPAFEHRMYLSLASVAIAAVFGTDALLARVVSSDRLRSSIGASLLAAVTIVLMSLTYARNETYRTHLVCLETAAAARPNNIRPWVSLASLYINQNQLDRAEEALQRAAAIRPQSDAVTRQLAPLRAVQGRFDEAERLYLQLTKMPFNNYTGIRIYQNLAWVQVTQGRPDAAVATMRQLIDKQPDVANNWMVLTAVLLAAGREEEAQQAASEVRRLDRSQARKVSREARNMIFAQEKIAVELEKVQGLWLAAAAIVVDENPDPEMFDTLARAYAMHGRYDAAAATARR